MSDHATRNSQARMVASALTWPVEKSKLLFQASRPVSSFWKLPLRHHVMGMVSSSLQRGGSAFLMFYTQSKLSNVLHSTTSSPVVNQSLAGALGGTVSAPFHTYWELIKVRGTLPSFKIYHLSLVPMLFRHGVFDGTFFAVHALCPSDYGSGVRFAASAATASFTNLVFDVWKTRGMQEFPKHVRFRAVVKSLPPRVFLANYVVKGAELSTNWFVVGCIKDHCFTAGDD